MKKQHSTMNVDDAFPRRIRWLAIVAGIVDAAFLFFGSPLSSLSPIVLVVAVVLQPRWPLLGRWITWILAAIWTLNMVQLSYALLLSFPPYRDAVVILPACFLLLSTILFLWLDLELIAEAIKRMRDHRTKALEDPPVSRSMLIFCVLLNIWAVASAITVLYRGYQTRSPNQILNVFVWAAAAIALDAAVVRRHFWARGDRTGTHG
jgi:hypothetical protein